VWKGGRCEGNERDDGDDEIDDLADDSLEDC
jgi:hypothetical protein